MVRISGNKNTIVAGIAAIPRMNAIPCDPKAEMSHHRMPIVFQAEEWNEISSPVNLPLDLHYPGYIRYARR